MFCCPLERINVKIREKNEEESAILCARIQNNTRFGYTSRFNNSGAPDGAQRIASGSEKNFRVLRVVQAHF